MTTEQIINVSFDAWSVLFCTILVIGTLASRRFDIKQSQALLGLLLANIALNASEVFAYLYRGNVSDMGFYAVRISNFIVFFCNHLVLFFAVLYVCITIEKKGGTVTRRAKTLMVGMIVLGLVLLVLSRVFGFYYAFDELNRYYRLSSYWIMFVLEGAVIVTAAIITLLNWKFLAPLERMSFLAIEILPVIAIGLQLFTYGISLTVFASTISIAMIFMTYELECSSAIIDRERRMLNEVIVALAQAVDVKDAGTNGHSNRVAKYSRMIAERMGLDRAEADRIYRMAVLHDVGKIGVPDEVLNKEGKLTDEEYQLIQEHTLQGYDILKGIALMPELRDGARWHHERYDGKGYPDGMKGTDIPLAARIIGVADSYDAMTSDRIYRKRLPQDVARKEILDHMGTQFDPGAAQAMLEIIDEDTNFDLHG